jgi:hypothetical protein
MTKKEEEEKIKSSIKDVMNRFRTQSLFLEFKTDRYYPLFTLKDEDKVVEIDGKERKIPSLHLIYLSYPHVPGKEYKFAKEVLGGWAHWKLLLKNRLINPFIHTWQAEMEEKLSAQAIESLIAMSKDAKGFAAAKWLADKGWKGARGRPSNEEVEGERKQMALASASLEEDMERVGLKLVKGL